MAPILGIWASGAQPPQYAGSFESIATTTLTGTTSSITFSSIPGTYTHLQIRGILRGTLNNGGGGLSAYLRFNSDSSNNYPAHGLGGNGSTAYAAYRAASSIPDIGAGADNSATANDFGANVIDILDYANTNKYKTVRAISGFDNNGAGFVQLNSLVWMSTSAVTSITVAIDGSNLVQYSSLALYGIKGA